MVILVAALLLTRILGPTAVEFRILQVRLRSAKKEKSRRCPYVPETCMLVDGAYGNTVQQKKWANDAN